MYPQYSQSNGANGSVSNNQRLFVFDEPRFNPNIINDIANDFGFKVQTFIEPAPYVNYATTERSNFPSKLVTCRICSLETCLRRAHAMGDVRRRADFVGGRR